MPEKYRHWEKLDNTANLFPVIASDTTTNTYRLTCILKENVDPAALQEALEMVLPQFPGFNVSLRMGVFWYYLEENGRKAPDVVREQTYPCRLIHGNRNRHYMFRVLYYGKRIHLEVFHALADGMGGITFLREIVYQYLRITHPDLGQRLGNDLSDGTSLDREDSFLRNFRKAGAMRYKSGRAFLIRGEHLPYNGFGVITGYTSVQALKQVAKEKYHTTINDYLVAAFIYAAWNACPDQISEKRPVRVAVPVNLRPYFDSNTTKNFFVMVSAEFRPERNSYSFPDIVEITKQSLAEQMTKENLEAVFSFAVSAQKLLVARSIPLPFKNLAMKLAYTRSARANTTTITNIGRIDVAPDYRQYIEAFTCLLPFSTGQYLKASIASYGDVFSVSFSSALCDTAIQKGVLRQMASDGLQVKIETNGAFYR